MVIVSFRRAIEAILCTSTAVAEARFDLGRLCVFMLTARLLKKTHESAGT